MKKLLYKLLGNVLFNVGCLLAVVAFVGSIIILTSAGGLAVSFFFKAPI